MTINPSAASPKVTQRPGIVPVHKTTPGPTPLEAIAGPSKIPAHPRLNFLHAPPALAHDALLRLFFESTVMALEHSFVLCAILRTPSSLVYASQSPQGCQGQAKAPGGGA